MRVLSFIVPGFITTYGVDSSRACDEGKVVRAISGCTAVMAADVLVCTMEETGRSDRAVEREILPATKPIATDRAMTQIALTRLRNWELSTGSQTKPASCLLVIRHDLQRWELCSARCLAPMRALRAAPRPSLTAARSGPESIFDPLYYRADGAVVARRVAQSKPVNQSAATRKNDLLIEDLFAFEA